MLFSFLKAKASQQARRISGRSDTISSINGVLNFFDSEGLYPDFRVIERGANESECLIDGKKYLMFCSNNYLSLSEHPEVKEAAKSSIEKYGVGPGGSRAVNGTVDVIVELEAKIAELTGTEDCLTFPTGYMANVGVFKALMDSFFNGMPNKTEDSVIFSDEYNHGSIVDGCRLSRAKKIVFRHNDINDLKEKISKNNLPNKLIVTEGVFSTEGEITNIGDYVEIARSSGSLLMVDDAHGVAILGRNGGGTPELTKTSNKIDILMGSMDKAFGGTGGYLCGSKSLIRYLRVAMSSSILSSALPTVAASAMSKAVDIIRGEEGSNKRITLLDKADKLRGMLADKGFQILGDATLPAVPLFIGDEKKALDFAGILFKQGIFSTVFRWPAVPQGSARLRLTLMSSHTMDQIDRLVVACVTAGKELKII